MSYDLFVFDPPLAPHEPLAFLAWYDDQVRWEESHGYNNPDIPSPPLRAWFHDLIATFPPMNGPLARDAADHTFITDYSLARACIYAAFAYSKQKEAFRAVTDLALKHRIGFLEASSNKPAIWLPSDAGWTKIKA